MKKIDLTNQKIGKLLVIQPAENIITPNGRSHTAWKCRCECGKYIVARTDLLKKENIKSCGCLKKEHLEKMQQQHKRNLLGLKFGYLTVIQENSERTSSGQVLWICRCDCGNVIKVSSGNLLRKKESTISCGCIHSKGQQKINKILSEMKISFETQKSFDSCRFPSTNKLAKFDFYIKESNILIEYDGIQHFEQWTRSLNSLAQRQERDKYKDIWCENNGYKLIRIPYTDLDKINGSYMRQLLNHYGWREI